MDVSPTGGVLRRHDEVEVWSAYSRRWLDGFTVARVERDAQGSVVYVRRQSDGVVLPQPFATADVRRVDAAHAGW